MLLLPREHRKHYTGVIEKSIVHNGCFAPFCQRLCLRRCNGKELHFKGRRHVDVNSEEAQSDFGEETDDLHIKAPTDV